jgi:hypothetical protein
MGERQYYEREKTVIGLLLFMYGPSKVSVLTRVHDWCMEENQTGSDRRELGACPIYCDFFLIPGLITLPRSALTNPLIL